MNCTKDFQINVASAPTDYLWWKMEEPNGNRIDSIQGKILVEGLAGTGKINSGAGKILLGANAQVNVGDVAFLDMNHGDGLLYAGVGWTLVGWFNWAGFDESTTLFGIYTNGSFHWAQAQGLPGAAMFIKSSDPAGNTLVPNPPVGWNFFILEFVAATGKLQWEINRNGTIGQLAVNAPTIGNHLDVFLDLYGTTIITPAVTSWTWDEIGMFPTLLTDPQKDYLYNAGAGRTSPIVLP